MNKTFIVRGRTIGEGAPCFIIAEISGNHHQKYAEAEALLRAAYEAGADAVKLQTYTSDTLTLNSDNDYFTVKGKDQPDAWKKRTLHDLYEEAHTPWDWQPKLKKLADELGIILFSSAFDGTSVDFLENMGVELYKVASYEAVHIPLLRKIAQTKKPVVISTGFASKEEVALAVGELSKAGTKDIALLHCVTAYSDTPRMDEMNLATIADMKKEFGTIVGFSDNNGGILAPVIAAVAAGASLIEKHIIVSRELGGPDARFSLEPEEFKEMVRRIRLGEQNGIDAAIEGIGTHTDVDAAIGAVHYGPASEREAENMFFRPSIWIKKDIKKGEAFTHDNIRVARPYSGLAPKHMDAVLGKAASRDISFATPLSWELVQ